MIKTPILGETLSVLHTKCHVTPVVTRYFLFTSVTFRAPCHVIGHQMICCKCYGERFLHSDDFYLTLLPDFRGFRGSGSSTSKLAGVHAAVEDIVTDRLFVRITQYSAKSITW